MNIDIDSVEYDNKGIRAYVEFKHGTIQSLDLCNFQFKRLAEAARLRYGTVPVFANIYYYFKKDGSLLDDKDDPNGLSLLAHAQHLIVGINQCAISLLNGEHAVKMTELQWATFLHEKIRKIPAPSNLKLFDSWRKVREPEIINSDWIHQD
jgi:hypothetical protein